MSQIRVIYHPNPDGSRHDPGFPATDQHQDAVRFPVDHPTKGALNVDAIGAPTVAEVDVFLGIDAASQNAANRLSAIDATIASFSFGGATLAQLKAMDNSAFDSWWAANITNLAQANTVLKLLARITLRRTL